MDTPDSITQSIAARFAQTADLLRQAGPVLAGRIAQAAELIVRSLRDGGGLYVFGNGGSAADAQHIAGELVGRFLKDRRPLRAVALNTDGAVLTALANDFEYGIVFARQLEALGRPGDVALGISTSGNSVSVANGLAKARELGLRTIALTGQGGGRCAALADVLLDVPSRFTPMVQETHVVIYHILCQHVEAH